MERVCQAKRPGRPGRACEVSLRPNGMSLKMRLPLLVAGFQLFSPSPKGILFWDKPIPSYQWCKRQALTPMGLTSETRHNENHSDLAAFDESSGTQTKPKDKVGHGQGGKLRSKRKRGPLRGIILPNSLRYPSEWPYKPLAMAAYLTPSIWST